MREKLKIANQLRVSRRDYSNNPRHRKLCTKCYYAYIVECIIKGKKGFKVSFGARYIRSFSKRLSDWCEYIKDSIYRFFLIHFTPNNDNTFKKYELIHSGVSKPIHLKVAETPDEICLYHFLESNGFEIIDEFLHSESTVYYVVKV